MRDIIGHPSMMYDQIHPNAQGYALIAERIAQVAGPVLKRADQALDMRNKKAAS